MEVKQNTLYLTTAGLYIARDHLTLRVEYKGELKLAVPIHHLESVCVFGPISLSPQALALCWEHGVGVNHFSENGYFMGRWEGVPNTSVTRRPVFTDGAWIETLEAPGGRFAHGRRPVPTSTPDFKKVLYFNKLQSRQNLMPLHF